MPGGQKWTFRQLSGPRKTIELTGWAAPFGRPRQGPIVNDGLSLRVFTRRYAGNDVPTKHVFGIQYKDWELHGRWMDTAGGAGFARSMASNFKSFFADGQAIAIQWGDVLTVTGLVEDIDLERESEADIAWKLKISVFQDIRLGTTPKVPTHRAAESYTNRIVEAMSDVLNTLPDTPETMRAGFIESLDSIIAFINAPGALLVSVANQMSSLETATVAEIRRFRAGLGQYKTALTTLRTTFESAPTDIALAVQEVDDELRLMQSQAIFGKTMAEAMAEAAAADKAAADVEKSKIKAIYVAKDGDTWERVSIAEYGSSARVKDILQMNTLQAGSQPVAGTIYPLPV